MLGLYEWLHEEVLAENVEYRARLEEERNG
jgi:hypothetical protein